MVPSPSRGFTLIELLVVIAIIGLLASIILANVNTALSKARDARRVLDLHNIQTALELYYDTNGTYPNPGCSWSSWSGPESGYSCPWSSFIPPQYIASVPADPLNVDLGNCNTVANCHIYEYCAYNNGQNYVLAVNLENPPALSKGNNPNCPNGGPNIYWVTN